MASFKDLCCGSLGRTEGNWEDPSNYVAAVQIECTSNVIRCVTSVLTC